MLTHRASMEEERKILKSLEAEQTNMQLLRNHGDSKAASFCIIRLSELRRAEKSLVVELQYKSQSQSHSQSESQSEPESDSE